MVYLAALVALALGFAGCSEPGGDENVYVDIHNATDKVLCFKDVCDPGIEPKSESEWLLESCFSQGVVFIETEQGEEIYRRMADCPDWEQALIVINERGGQFIVADTLRAPYPGLGESPR